MGSRRRSERSPLGVRRGTRGRAPLPAFSVAFLIAGAFALAHLLTPGTSMLPVERDSAKYHRLGEGVERLLHEEGLLGDLWARRLTPAQRDTLGIDRWELQHAPAYLVPLGIGYALFPANLNAGRLLSLLCYAAAAGLLVLVGGTLVGRRWRWLLLPLYLAYLPLVYYGVGIATEPLSMLALLLVAWRLIRLHRRPSRGNSLLAGLSLALLFLAKTTFRPVALLLLLAALLFWVFRRRPGLALRLGSGAIAPIVLWGGLLLAAGAPLNPLVESGEASLWLYRGNYVPDQGWETVGLGDGLGPELTEAGKEVVAAHPEGLSEEEYKRLAYARGFRNTVQRQPVDWLLLVWKKFGLFWTTPPRKEYLRGPLGAWPIPWNLQRLLFLLGLVGIAVAARRAPRLWLAAALMLGVAGVHAGSHLVARYAVPVLPLWFAYALLGTKTVWVTGRRWWARGDWGPRGPWIWAAGGVLALLVGWQLRSLPDFLPSGGLRLAYAAGVLLIATAPFALLPLLRLAACRVRARARRRPAQLWIGALLFAVAATGMGLGDPDWDRRCVTLDTAGQSVRQRIRIPWEEVAQRGGIDSAWVEADLLRAVGGRFALDLLVGGERVHSFCDTLGGRYEAFLFDSLVHCSQARYRRVADLYAEFVRRYVDPRYGAKSPGYDYFRRWVRMPVPLSLLDAETVEIELRLRECSGGAWVLCYGDRRAVRMPERSWVGPAQGENPFEHSSYRAEFFGADRQRMDARLARRQTLRSVASQSWVRNGPHAPWSAVPGELRIRLRARLRGQMIARVTEGRSRLVWVTEPQAGDRTLGPDEIRQFQWWRDDYFDGTWIF
ncbi:MAG: hypothetical protein GF330_01770 [Candidatus Eisenbacteria bacterium]|nr:hypothetical protein [Candidatus Eisenbacteria bacterium]